MAKFLCVLLSKYEKAGKVEIFDTTLYKYALEEALLDLASKDMTQHGHLLVLKEKLIKLIGHNKPDIKTLALF